MSCYAEPRHLIHLVQRYSQWPTTFSTRKFSVSSTTQQHSRTNPTARREDRKTGTKRKTPPIPRDLHLTFVQRTEKQRTSHFRFSRRTDAYTTRYHCPREESRRVQSACSCGLVGNKRLVETAIVEWRRAVSDGYCACRLNSILLLGMAFQCVKQGWTGYCTSVDRTESQTTVLLTKDQGTWREDMVVTR